MAVIPELPEGGAIAAAGAGLFGAALALMKLWREFGKYSMDASAEKRIELAAVQSQNRIIALEAAIAALQEKLNAAERGLGVHEGKLEAEKARVTDLENHREYWKTRAIALEKEVKHLKDCVAWLSTKVQQQSFKISALEGDIPIESLRLDPLGPCPIREHEEIKENHDHE